MTLGYINNKNKAESTVNLDSLIISILNGSPARITAMGEWSAKLSRRKSIHMNRKRQKEILDMLMTKVIARDYTLFTYCPKGGFFADMFIIGIRNKNDSLWRIRLYPWSMDIMPENSNIYFIFEGIELFYGPWFPHTWKLRKIVKCLLEQQNG